ncbi:MAG: dihydrolipoamide acetyltransferase family protein [Chloroflexota bacterium]|nr:dihydrolipoamide acetyltransferase family protein [Chloroflexota bacterium]
MAVAIAMPNLGMYTIEGEVTRWLVEDGASVAADQPVLELTTEKTTVEIPAPAAGILHQVVPVGGRVQVEGILGHILAPGESPPATTPAAAPAAPRAAAAAPPRTPAKPPPVRAGRGRLRATPVARRRARELGVDLTTVTGSGPGGRITEADVQAAAASTDSPAPLVERGPGDEASAPRVLRRVPLTGMRGLIAQRMQHSLTSAAQLTLTREVDARPLVQAREQLVASAADEGMRVSYDVLLAKSLAAALLAHPALNATIEGDEIVQLAEAHIGVAVAVEDGLVVPVLRDAAHRPALDLARELTGLTDRARQGRLQPSEMAGGTATLTNLGAYHIDAFTPIINPPQSAILGVGSIAPRPVVDEDGALTVRPTVHLSLTFDHRVADGVAAATLLESMVSQWQQTELWG